MSFSIIGTGSALPVCVKTNEELSKIVDTTDEWITTRTGIKERHVLTDESLSDISCRAAESALQDAGITADELDLIICTTMKGDYITPSMACIIQSRLSASCPAFDISAACSGFIYALDIAAGYFAGKRAKYILIIAAEAMSRFVDWKDRTTCVLFGDGAGAAVLGQGDDLLSVKLSAQGKINPLYACHASGNSPFGPQSENNTFLKMNGREVFKFAVTSMCADIKSVIEEAGIAENDVDYVLPHQANIRIIEAAQSKLNIPNQKFLTNIRHCGNVSAASIPILLDEENKKGTFKKGDLLVMTAFGGGLTTGACVIRWHKN